MIVLDLFCGTKSVANAFAARGHKVFTIEKAKIPEALCQHIVDICEKYIKE